MTGLPRRFERERERVDRELEPLFFDEVINVYMESDFFAKLCCREVWGLESGFIALPQELRAIAFHHAVLINRTDICKAVILHPFSKVEENESLGRGDYFSEELN